MQKGDAVAVPPILVTGATGRQGGAVAQALLNQGYPVRALSRSKEKLARLEQLGAESIVGNLQDPAVLEEALNGVDRAFLLTTWHEGGIDFEIEQGRRFIDAAQAAGIAHLVYASTGAPDTNTGIPHFETKWQVEQHLRRSGIPYTAIRPAYFMENFGAPAMVAAMKTGYIRLPIRADIPVQMVATETIGTFGAAAFVRGKEWMGRAIELAGDELTMAQLTERIAKASGKPLVYEEIPDEEAEEAVGPERATMFRWFASHDTLPI